MVEHVGEEKLSGWVCMSGRRLHMVNGISQTHYSGEQGGAVLAPWPYPSGNDCTVIKAGIG